jgi:hypothetical protein
MPYLTAPCFMGLGGMLLSYASVTVIVAARHALHC